MGGQDAARRPGATGRYRLGPVATAFLVSAIGCAAVAGAPVPASLAQRPAASSCAADLYRVEYPGLGSAAPTIAVTFSCQAGLAPVSAIFVLQQRTWRRVHSGDFVRGSLLSGRGGKGMRYRLVDAREGYADLAVDEGALVLRSTEAAVQLWPLPLQR